MMIEIKHKTTGQLLYQGEGFWLGDSDLCGVALSGARLTHQYLKEARLRGADLAGADLRGSTLTGADLEEAGLAGANLSDCVVTGARLRRADLSAAALPCAHLSGADLSEVCLRGADLRWATLAGACLNGADLTGAALGGAVLDGARFDSSTRWPDGFCPPSRIGPATARAAGVPLGFRRAATRRLSRAARGTLRLWSVQTPIVWERLQREGVLYTDADWIDPGFVPAYDWLRGQMARRIPGYTGHYPWWAFQRPKPDLRRGWPGRSCAPGDLRVRLELAVPAEQVLLSSYDAWHAVLNAGFLCLCEGEDDAGDDEIRMSGLDPRVKPLPEPWNGWMRWSWERVFDLEALAASEYWAPVNRVQATFERLELAHVVSVTEFVTRKDATGG